MYKNVHRVFLKKCQKSGFIARTRIPHLTGETAKTYPGYPGYLLDKGCIEKKYLYNGYMGHNPSSPDTVNTIPPVARVYPGSYCHLFRLVSILQN